MNDVMVAASAGQTLMTTVRALARRFAVAERADVACCGMTVAQAATLEALCDEQGMRLKDLSKRLGISASTLTRNLARLRERKLVQTSPDDSDGRAFRVSLTASGQRAAIEVRQQEERFFDLVLGQLSPGRADEIVNALDELWTAVRTATQRCCPGAFDHLMTDSTESEGRVQTHDCQRC